MAAADLLSLDESRAQRAGRRVLSLALGAGISLAILLGLARIQHTAESAAPPTAEDLRTVILPPPPPPAAQFARAEPPPPAELALPPAEVREPGDVRVAVALRSPPSRPVARVVTDLSLDVFRPPMKTERDARRVYSRTEVDQPAQPLRQVAPHIPYSLLRDVKQTRITVLFIVDERGVPGDFRVLQSISPEVDARVLEALRDWLFRPARKNRQAVRQWVEQPIVVSPPTSSPFQ